MPDASLILTDLPEGEALLRLGELGATPREARRLWAGAVQRHLEVGALGGIGQVRRPVLDAVRSRVVTPRLRRVAERHDPSDGFRALVFELPDGARVETVQIPIHRSHYVVCVSSQVGCALGCAFCATGDLGFSRNLAAWEMVEQVLEVRARADRPVRGVVFMGMGEPLLNYQATMNAASILRAPAGGAISGKAISVSTAGVVPGIRRFTREGHPYRLMVSLTSAIPEKRGEVMPVERRWPVEALWEAVREHATDRRVRATLAYVMIRGFNTGREDAEALRRLVGDTPVTIDLIDVNDARGRWLPPEPHELEHFRDLLQCLGQPVVRRYSGGKGIAAACGMLAAREPRTRGMEERA